jgi:RecA/RadA recombinase
MTEKDEKKRALDLALAQIEKQYGKGAVMKLGDRGPTGRCPGDLQRLLGVGYCARRRAASLADASSRSSARSRPAKPP